MKKTLCALVLAAGLATGVAAEAAFSDVADNAWYAEAVAVVTEGGLMNGTGDGHFSPDVTVTRGMAVATLWRMAGQPQAQAAHTFPDVLSGYFYADAVAWATECGIVSGLGDGRFGGGDSVTREQLAVFLWRYAQHTGQEVASGVLDAYSDNGAVQPWAKEGMAHAVGAGLITGRDDGTLQPQGPATRAQLAVILQRMLTPAAG